SQWNTKTHLTDDPLYISSDGIVRFDLFVEERNTYSVVKYRIHNRQTYQLMIESLTEVEAGNYTCQIYLPNQNYEELPRMFRSVTIQIAPYITAASAATITVQEGENVTLVCEAYGYPLPNITWTRGDGSPLPHGGLQLINGLYIITKVNATDRGLFICTADNNVKPHASYSVRLKVLFAPYCAAVQDTVGQDSDRMFHATLECLVSAEPRAEVVWYKENRTTLINEQILDNDKYTLGQQHDERLKADEKWYTLKIKNVVRSDYRGTPDVMDLEKDQLNYVRLIYLLNVVSPKAVRVVFNREIHPTKLTKHLNKSKIKLQGNKQFISKTQWNLIYPSYGEPDPDSEKFDITLMVFVLRHLTDIKIYDELPLIHDKSEATAISRLKFYRNAYSHNSNGSVTRKEYANLVHVIVENICVLDPRLKSDCDKILAEEFVERLRADPILYNFLQTHASSIMITRQLSEEKGRPKKNEWKKKLTKFYYSEDTKAVEKLVSSNQIILISGLSGSGKSAIAFHIALNLEDKQEYDLIPVSTCADITSVINPCQKQVFVFDDVFGTSSFDAYRINCWQNSMNNVYDTFIAKTKTKIILTCRSDIYKGIKERGLEGIISNCSIYEMQGLTLKEKKEIAKLYLPMERLPEDATIEKYQIFPLLCSLWFDKTSQPIPFGEIDLLKESDESYLALAFLIVFNNKLNVSLTYDNYRIIMQDLYPHRMDYPPSQQKIWEILSNHCYIKKESCFSFIHDKIFDEASQQIGMKFVKCIIEHGNSSFISSKLRLESLKTIHSKEILSIPIEFEDAFFTRTIRDLREGMNWDVLGSNQTHIKDYRVKLITQLKNSELSLQKTLKDGSTALHVVAAHGYYDLTQFFLEVEASMKESVDNTGRTPLHYAACYGKNQIVNLLLKNGSLINAKDCNNVTPLMLSCYNRHMPVVKEMLDNNADINCENEYRWSALHIACFKGLKCIVELILKRNCKTLDSKISTGATPLYLACEIGNEVIATILLQNKAEVNYGSCTGSTPLYIASQKGHIGLVKLLLKFGASVHINTINGFTPLHAAVLAHNTDIVQLLLSHDALVNTVGGERIISLHLACENGDQAMIDFLIKNAAEIETADMFGETALFKACTHGFENIVEYLTSKGASVNQGNKQGRTPLHVSCAADNKSMCYLLLKKGALINQVDIEGQTPLYETCKMGFESICNILIENDAIINQGNIHNSTPLHISCLHRHYGIVELLLESNATINQCDTNGNNPLHYVCEHGLIKLAKRFCERHALINQCNYRGETPLHLACRRGQLHIVNYLLEQNCAVNHNDVDGTTPLHTACHYNYKEIVEKLMPLSKLNTRNSNGETALSIACKKCFDSTDIVKLLCYDSNGCQNDISVNIYNNEGMTPLHIACNSGNADLVELLLKLRANIDLRNNKGETCILMVCKSGIMHIAKLLIKCNANVNIEDKLKKTPLSVALKSHNANLINLLQRHNAKDYRIQEKEDELRTACREENEEKVVGILEITPDYDCINKDDIHGWTPLHVACMMQNTNIVNLLLTKHADINKITNTGATPLYLASFYGRKKIVEILISNRADINKCNLNRFSPLHISCYFGYKAICTTLLQTGSDKNCEDNDHETPLSIACEMGHCEIVELLLENEVRLDKKNGDGNAPIHIACIKGHTNIVERMILINRSIVNLPNIKGSTPLHISCQKGHLEIVRVLLTNNALLSLTDEGNCVPFFLACVNGRTEIVEEILNLQNGPSVNEHFQNDLVPLHVACSYGHQELTEILLNWKDIEVEIRDINGMTALYMACQSDNIKLTNLLLDHKAISTQSDIRGITPLHIACIQSNADMVDLLLKFDGLIKRKIKGEATPLYYACQKSNIEIAQLLLVKGVDVDDGNNNCTPLQMACLNGNYQLVQILVQYKANLNKSDDEGRTPLYLACSEGHKKVANLLLSNNANVNKWDTSMQTPIFISSKEGHSDVIDVLTKYNADINQPNKDGTRPLHAACENNHTEVVAVLLKNNAGINNINTHNETPLHIASGKGYVKIVQELLKKDSIDINIRNISGNTPLHNACMIANIKVVELLLQAKPEVGLANNDNNTALYIACQRNLYPIVSLLLKYTGSVDVETRSSTSMLTPLHVVCIQGNVDIVRLILEYVNDVKSMDILCLEGYNSLHYAIIKRHIEIVNLLRKKGEELLQKTKS
ncbi:Hypothetical predicted protein, partial [Mytilus galloprovincialis]